MCVCVCGTYVLICVYTARRLDLLLESRVLNKCSCCHPRVSNCLAILYQQSNV